MNLSIKSKLIRIALKRGTNHNKTLKKQALEQAWDSLTENFRCYYTNAVVDIGKFDASNSYGIEFDHYEPSYPTLVVSLACVNRMKGETLPNIFFDDLYKIVDFYNESKNLENILGKDANLINRMREYINRPRCEVEEFISIAKIIVNYHRNRKKLDHSIYPNIKDLIVRNYGRSK